MNVGMLWPRGSFKNEAAACKVSIISERGSLGHTDFGELGVTNFTLIDRICVLHGGRVAENLFAGSTTMGVTNDLLNATHLAYSMVEKYAMVKYTAAVSFGSHDKDGIYEKPRADRANRMIDKETWKSSNDALARTEELLTRYKDAVEKLEQQHECIYDYVEFLDGHSKNSKVISRVCGYTVPTNIKSSGNKLRIRFASDSSVEKSGFQLRFIRSYMNFPPLIAISAILATFICSNSISPFSYPSGASSDSDDDQCQMFYHFIP